MGTVHIEPRLERRTFAPGREVFGQGEQGDCAYLLESGSVTIFQHLNGQRIELGTIKKGEIFGEMAAIDGGLRMATAVAVEQTVVTRVPKELFDRKLGEADRFVRGILSFFIRNIRNSHQTFVRRPRSVSDHLRLMMALNKNLHAFASHCPDTGGAAELGQALVALDRAVVAVRNAAARCPDNRHDLVVDEEEKLTSRRLVGANSLGR